MRDQTFVSLLIVNGKLSTIDERPTLRLRFSQIFLSVAILALIGPCFAIEIQFEELMKNPHRFNAETRRTANVEVQSSRQVEMFTLRPEDVEPAVFDPSHTNLLAKTHAEGDVSAGKIFAKYSPFRLLRRFYDGRRKYYYFRVFRSTFELVLPSQVQGWVNHPMPDRE